MLSFFPLDVLDEILDVTESDLEGFLTYSFNTISCHFIFLKRKEEVSSYIIFSTGCIVTSPGE